MKGRTLVALSAMLAAMPLAAARASMCPNGTVEDTPVGGSKAWFHYQLPVDPLAPEGRWVQMEGPFTACRGPVHMIGQPDDRGNAPAVVPVELVSMSLSGGSPLSLVIHESPMMVSAGAVSGVFNIFNGTFQAMGESFFDVFFVVCIEGLEAAGELACLHNAAPFRVRTNLFGPLPPDPWQRPYRHASGNPVDMLTAVGLTAAKADNGCHKPFFAPGPVPAACGMVQGVKQGGAWMNPFKLVAANVSSVPSDIASVTVTSAPPCLMIGAFAPEAGPDLWSASATAGPGCASWTATGVVEFGNGTSDTVEWSSD